LAKTKESLAGHGYCVACLAHFDTSTYHTIQ
jgi:hypothetical protein